MSRKIAPAYESKNFMKIGFCIQICIGKSDDIKANPAFIGVSVSNITVCNII